MEVGGTLTRFTHDEQRTMMTLWVIARSPLILGADMTKLDEATLALLTNDEVLAVNQNSAETGSFSTVTASSAGSPMCRRAPTNIWRSSTSLIPLMPRAPLLTVV